MRHPPAFSEVLIVGRMAFSSLVQTSSLHQANVTPGFITVLPTELTQAFAGNLQLHYSKVSCVTQDSAGWLRNLKMKEELIFLHPPSS